MNKLQEALQKRIAKIAEDKAAASNTSAETADTPTEQAKPSLGEAIKQATADAPEEISLNPSLPTADDVVNGTAEDVEVFGAQSARPRSVNEKVIDVSLKHLDLPPRPEVTAEPEELLKYNLEVLTLVVEAGGSSKEVLSELHGVLRDKPELGDLLMPEDLAAVTKAMISLTASTVDTKIKAKTKRIATKVAKETSVEKAASLLGGFTL